MKKPKANQNRNVHEDVFVGKSHDARATHTYCMSHNEK